MKFCPRCETEKPVRDFHRNAARHDGRAVYCKSCFKVLDAERNREPTRAAKRKEQQAAWFEGNRKAKLAANRRWKDQNAERVKASNAIWWRNNGWRYSPRVRHG